MEAERLCDCGGRDFARHCDITEPANPREMAEGAA